MGEPVIIDGERRIVVSRSSVGFVVAIVPMPRNVLANVFDTHCDAKNEANIWRRVTGYPIIDETGEL